MATLYVAEYAALATPESGGNCQVAMEPPIAEQTVAIGGASATLPTAFSKGTKYIRVHTDSICSIAIGPSPTATTSLKRLAANQTEYFGVQKGWNTAVIANT